MNLEKENIQLKKLNNKLIEEIKALKNFNKNNIEYKSYENNNNDLIEKTTKISNKYNIKKESQTIKKKDNSIKVINNRKLDDSDDKIIYNNDDESEEEENSLTEKNNNLRIKIDKEENTKRILANKLILDKGFTTNPINRIHEINKKEREKECTSLIKYKDKIIGCNRENIKLLIKGKKYKMFENEINTLNKEKEKIENDLLKFQINQEN